MQKVVAVFVGDRAPADFFAVVLLFLALKSDHFWLTHNLHKVVSL